MTVCNELNSLDNLQIIFIFLSVLDADFSHPTPFSISFDTTSTNGDVECVDVSTIDDMALEGDHDFSISLSSSNLEDNVQLSTQSVTAVINDNDSKCSELILYGYYISILRSPNPDMTCR